MKIFMSAMFIGLLLAVVSSHGEDSYYRSYPADVNPPSGYSGDANSYRQYRNYYRSYPADVNPPSGYSGDANSYRSRQHYQEYRSYPHDINTPSGY